MTSAWQPSVSVVVPVYNGEETIVECLDSLLALQYPEDRVELVVVDNGSRDGTVRLLRRYGDCVTRLAESKRGPAAARNAGLRAAGGDVVAFTDADCRVDPDWLAAIVAPLEDPRVGIVGGTIRATSPGNDIELFGEVIHDHRKAIEVFQPPCAITMNWASRRGVLQELGGFDERFRRGEDGDLSYRVSQAGYTLAFAPAAVVYHRNEDRLRGLFREGFAHGFHDVLLLKHHEEFVRAFGHSRLDRRSYVAIGARMLDWARGKDPARSRCVAVFNSGKKAGKLLGSMRFRHLEL
jgi:glycosyltransferase involved in cell wall biosynthesis